MSKKRKVVIIIFACIIISGLFIVKTIPDMLSQSIEEINVIDTEKYVGIGKKFTIMIEDDEVSDYTILNTEKFDLWNEVERKKFANYMKDNELIIPPGKYVLNQALRFEYAKKIFKLESKTKKTIS